jgi:PST family polysaccharide transporter
MSGAGAYSFVLGSLAQAVVVAALVLRTARVPFRFGLDRVVARRLLVFGIPLAAGLAVESVVMYSDSVIVGHVLGTAMLGFYLLAWNISSWAPGLVGAAVRYVSVPAFSRLAENESETGSETFSHSVQRVLPLMFAFVVPIAASLMVLSPALIGTLYGPHWLPAGEALRFLAVVMMARLLTALVFDIQTGLGNTKMTVWLNLAWLAALLPALWIGAHRDGIRGVAMGHAFVAVTVAMPLAGWFLHRAGVDVRPIVRRCVRPLLAGTAAGLAMTVMSWALHAGVLQLLVGGSTGLLLYLCLVVPAEGRVATRSWVAVHLRSRRETLA